MAVGASDNDSQGKTIDEQDLLSDTSSSSEENSAQNDIGNKNATQNDNKANKESETNVGKPADGTTNDKNDYKETNDGTKLGNENLGKDTYENKNEDEKKEEKRFSRRSSHYLQNIQMTNSSLGLTLGSEKKEATLLAETQTVARFSPLWKQVILFYNYTTI